MIPTTSRTALLLKNVCVCVCVKSGRNGFMTCHFNIPGDSVETFGFLSISVCPLGVLLCLSISSCFRLCIQPCLVSSMSLSMCSLFSFWLPWCLHLCLIILCSTLPLLQHCVLLFIRIQTLVPYDSLQKKKLSFPFLRPWAPLESPSLQIRPFLENCHSSPEPQMPPTSAVVLRGCSTSCSL